MAIQTYADIVDYTMLMLNDQVDNRDRLAPSRPGLVRKDAGPSACANCGRDSTIVTLGSWAYDWGRQNPAQT